MTTHLEPTGLRSFGSGAALVSFLERADGPLCISYMMENGESIAFNTQPLLPELHQIMDSLTKEPAN